jgi:hypothetical protein
MTKNKNDLVITISTTLVSIWKSYKQANRTRVESPNEAFIKGLLGVELDDGQAAALLIEDVSKAVQKRKTKKSFEKIIENSL